MQPNPVSIKFFFNHPSLLSLGGVCLLVFLCFPVLSEAETNTLRPIALKAAVVQLVPSPVMPEAVKIKPDFQDTSFPLKDAVNLEAILDIIGPLSSAEAKFLVENRFLVRPKPRQLTFRPSGNQPVYDEMLANFDGIGGSIREDLRVPHNARFIGPDIVLHAFNKYISRRLVVLESGPLNRHVEFMLTGLYDNARTLKDAGSGLSGQAWGRLMAQLVVPLVLIKNSGADSPGLDSLPTDDIKAALDIFKSYQSHFSPPKSADIRKELSRIYQAEALSSGGLGLVVANKDGLVSYSVFKPVGHYTSQPRLRAYYRAMAWLGYLGWDASTTEGLTDALNFALAMSYEAPLQVLPQALGSENSSPRTYAIRASVPAEEAAPAPVEPANIGQAWSRVMELNTFFIGLPETLSYLEWVPFLMKEANVSEFRADTAVDPALLERLLTAAPALASFKPYKQLSAPDPDRIVITVFPQRFTLPQLITEQLTYREGVNERAPLMFSGLWIPALLGQEYARELVPRQLALTFGGESLVLEDAGLREFIKLTSSDLLHLMDTLASGFGDNWTRPTPPWDSSLSYARISLLSSLASKPESGYPLYLQNPAYQARRLESILAAYAEILYDPPLTEKPLPRRPRSDKDETGPEVPLVKGFLEPDLGFWREMVKTTQFLADGFKQYGLFPEDLKEMGSLNRFQKRLERCAALSKKELQGQELTSDDYEFIRLFTLNWMAAPPGQGDLAPPLAEIQSAMLVPIQSFGLEGEPDSTVYEAHGEPNLILVLVGNEKSPRLTLGLTYNHFEITSPTDKPLKAKNWADMVYNRHSPDPNPNTPKLPFKNFWYDPLKP